MALQHARSLLFRGEDLGYGAGAPKEIIVPTVVTGTARAINTALGFSASTTQLTALFTGLNSAAAGLAGLNRVVVNRSSRYFLTLQGTLTNATAAQGSVLVHLPIPPLGMLFLPCTFSTATPVTVVANSTFALPMPGSSASSMPLAGTNVLTIEVQLEV